MGNFNRKYALLVFELIGFIFVASFILNFGEPHEDTLGWMRTIQVFKDGFYAGWSHYVPYPPLPQLALYIMSFTKYIDLRFLVVIPNIIALLILFGYLKRKGVAYASLLTLFNPYFLITGIGNGYTDTVFTLIALLAMHSFFIKNYRLFIIISTIAFLYKYQYIYMLIFLLILDFDVKQDFRLKKLFKCRKSLFLGLLFIAILFIPFPFYEGKLANGYGFLNSFLTMSEGAVLVAGVPNFVSLYYLLMNNFEFNPSPGWGYWSWINGAGYYKQFFFLNLMIVFSVLIYSRHRALEKLYLVFLSVLVFAPGLYSNHMGIVFPVLFYWLIQKEVHHTRYIYIAVLLFAAFHATSLTGVTSFLGLFSAFKYEITLSHSGNYATFLSLVMLGYFIYSWKHLLPSEKESKSIKLSVKSQFIQQIDQVSIDLNILIKSILRKLNWLFNG